MGRKNRNTKQKEKIQKEIAKINSFFSAEELYEKTKKKSPEIGIATIYRYLKEAKEKGELYTYSCDRKNIYSKGKKSHCHFECEKTGKIIHFELDNIEFLKNKIPGTITSFQLEVKGICKKCEIPKKN
ncbi:transcriptional repressor [Candidatus Woesearchaeota archaeon]|nr:transcriptional repressor [Candidatus Woesearchaeota archaeon]